MRLGGLGKLKKKIDDLIGSRTRNLPACNIVSQSNALSRAPVLSHNTKNISAQIIESFIM
jgi:hypothetical protein